MKRRVLIVEDQFVEANNIKIILKKAGYDVCAIARSVPEALHAIDHLQPEILLLDIFLQGPQTGVDLARILTRRDIPFVFLSANSDKKTLDAAKETNPYGFLTKPFREKDVLVMLDVALYRSDHFRRAGSANAGLAVAAETKPDPVFTDIVGKSKGLAEVLHAVGIVGPSQTSVLILGESGTGKELIAHAIHQQSTRKSKPLVVVNCGALPPNLIESELFGHEKGAFTGATEKRVGKFEQANEGTIFLDEVGELPLDLQVKFLRVLQEREIEPIGGKKMPIDVRVIAATNRNLEEEMAAGRFRIDLYYRLNIFPITIPPLRERKEDIEPLANYFVERYAKKERKEVSGVTEEVLRALCAYSWPGNVRELENIMQRCVLLATGHEVNSVSLPGGAGVGGVKGAKAQPTDRLKTMTENERDHILAALEHCGWKIYGAGGAAEMLDMNGATLHSRMKKLGIEKNVSFRKNDQ